MKQPVIGIFLYKKLDDNDSMNSSLVLQADALAEQATSGTYLHSKSEHISKMMQLLEVLRQQVRLYTLVLIL